jgi:hypothetical protein
MTCYSVLIFLIIDVNFLNTHPLAMCVVNFVWVGIGRLQKMCGKDGRQVITPLFTKFRSMLFCLDIFSCYILSANLTVVYLTVSMKVSFKKQMLQYQSRKYGNEIRMFMFLLVFVSEFTFHILKTSNFFHFLQFLCGLDLSLYQSLWQKFRKQSGQSSMLT